MALLLTGFFGTKSNFTKQFFFVGMKFRIWHYFGPFKVLISLADGTVIPCSRRSSLVTVGVFPKHATGSSILITEGTYSLCNGCKPMGSTFVGLIIAISANNPLLWHLARFGGLLLGFVFLRRGFTITCRVTRPMVIFFEEMLWHRKATFNASFPKSIVFVKFSK